MLAWTLCFINSFDEADFSLDPSGLDSFTIILSLFAHSEQVQDRLSKFATIL